jgi:DNA-binding response OmpR family regulator
MRILISEDDHVSRLMLSTTLQKWQYDVLTTQDGATALEALQAADAPKLAILDWMMPEMDGVDVCRALRSQANPEPCYIILLTAKAEKGDIVKGLEAGADDYLTKPFDRSELRARLQVGLRMIELQKRLAERVHQLEEALASVKQLQGLIPICSYCKKIRDDKNFWQQVECYVSAHTDARFSHGICPACLDNIVNPQLKKMKCEPIPAAS